DDQKQIKPEQARGADRDRGCVRQCGGAVHYDRNRFQGPSEISGLSEVRPERFNRRLAAVLAGFGRIWQASKTFLLVEKCLERVYRRGAVLAAAGSNPRLSI